MWRFKKAATDIQTEAFTESVSFDRVLYLHDITGSMAHATMLAQVGLITQAEKNAIVKGLQEIAEEIGEGRFTFRREYEDIHMNIEKALEEKIGDAAGKLHTARSRNDQIALDERMWLQR